MKKNLLFFIVFIIGSNLYSQPPVKIIAFEQESLPGAKPAGVTDENGNRVKKAAAKKNYFIFLSFKKTYNITPAQVFIRGKAFAIRSKTLKKTPVEYANNTVVNNPEKITLVPFTNDKVLGVDIAEISRQEKKPNSIQKLVDKNDVVISYVWNKKTYFVSLQKIKRLEPAANE